MTSACQENVTLCHQTAFSNVHSLKLNGTSRELHSFLNACVCRAAYSHQQSMLLLFFSNPTKRAHYGNILSRSNPVFWAKERQCHYGEILTASKSLSCLVSASVPLGLQWSLNIFMISFKDAVLPSNGTAINKKKNKPNSPDSECNEWCRFGEDLRCAVHICAISKLKQPAQIGRLVSFADTSIPRGRVNVAADEDDADVDWTAGAMQIGRPGTCDALSPLGKGQEPPMMC